MNALGRVVKTDSLPGGILVIQTAFLGDVVLTTPLFRALRRLWPEKRLTALTTPQAAPLIAEDPHLDAVLTYDKKGKDSLLSMAKTLRSGGYEMLVSPHRSHRTALLSLMSGIPIRIGYSDASFSWAYNRQVARPMGEHEVDRNLALLEALGSKPDGEDRKLYIGYGEAESKEVNALLAACGVDSTEKIIGLCPGSIWATKRWAKEGFAAVGKALAARGHRIVLLGGPDDREASAFVSAQIGAAAVDAAGKTSLKALAAWMDRLSLLISNDSAPLHVAAARNTPSVAVFGATTLGLGFGPFHAESRVVQVDLDCRPCGLHGGKSCPKGHFKCMGDITPDAVLNACQELFEANEFAARKNAHQ